MFADDDPSKMIAIFDWDMCTLGDPLSDVGALLTYWTQADDPPLVQLTTTMPVGDYGFLTRQELAERYAEKSGRDLSDISFYHVRRKIEPDAKNPTYIHNEYGIGYRFVSGESGELKR